MMNTRLATITRIATLFFSSVSALTQVQMHSRAQFRTIGNLNEKALASVVPSPRIQAYDLSPDGSQIALFVASGNLVEAPSWIVIVGTRDLKVMDQMRFGTGHLEVQGYAPQLAFSPDGKFLAVEDGQVVRLLEANSLKTARTIVSDHSMIGVPVGLLMASKSNVIAVSFGTGAPVLNYMEKRTIHTELIDISSGRLLSSWASSDIPFSVSPNAKFVTVSDRDSVGSVLRAVVVDAVSGKRIFKLADGFAFKNASSGDSFVARIVAKFVSEDEVVVTPDGNKDQAGYDVGQSIKFLRVKDSQVLHEVFPEHYGPTGEIAVSADQNILACISRYVDPKYLTHHRAVPINTRPELVMLSKQNVFSVAGRKQLPELLSLRKRSLFDASSLRISSDGSLISVAEDYGVTLLATR